MGIFSRLSDIINSNLNSLLERAENPEKLLKNIIQEMEDTLVEVRTQAAKTIALKKQLLRRLDTLEAQQANWQDKAQLAINKARDDLARQALIEKAQLDAPMSSLNDQLRFVDEDIEKYHQDISHLEQKLSDARTRAQQLNSRIHANRHHLDVQEKTSEARMHKITSQLEQFEQKMDSIEAQVESHQLGKSQDLQKQLDELAVEDDIEKELSQLKKRIESTKE